MEKFLLKIPFFRDWKEQIIKEAEKSIKKNLEGKYKRSLKKETKELHLQNEETLIALKEALIKKVHEESVDTIFKSMLDVEKDVATSVEIEEGTTKEGKDFIVGRIRSAIAEHVVANARKKVRVAVFRVMKEDK